MRQPDILLVSCAIADARKTAYGWMTWRQYLNVLDYELSVYFH